MGKWQQQFSIGYFVVALILLFALQTFFASTRVETISYSQFKMLAEKGLLSNVVIGEKIIHGEIKPEGLKEVLSAERLKQKLPEKYIRRPKFQHVLSSARFLSLIWIPFISGLE